MYSHFPIYCVYVYYWFQLSDFLDEGRESRLEIWSKCLWIHCNECLALEDNTKDTHFA